MESNVYIKRYNPPKIKRKEMLRYAGIREENEELSSLVDECVAQAAGAFSYSVCYARFDVLAAEDVLDLGFCKTDNARLFDYFSGCGALVLFAATVGAPIDRLIARCSVTSPARAIVLQAFAAERIESLCDAFEAEMREAVCAEGLDLKPRFSPGYGGVSLELQRDVFSALDCPRKIGLTLNESLMMSPAKSVTAFMGIKKHLCK